ncbi:hypothetical protein [Mycobacterium syngnathidarum]|uniref:hypothetical protein n=1 Tax=Mycobacterium syngnathidarum TaxID=1908205 RepID=UPI0013F4C15C|nr:hypothetical protein [Mycobacterium syngnathidarum]
MRLSRAVFGVCVVWGVWLPGDRPTAIQRRIRLERWRPESAPDGALAFPPY